MMWKLLEDVKGPEAPTHLAVVFDAGAVTFRNTIYDKYKANRPPPPEDLIPQFPLVRDATRAFGVSCVEMDGFEADDLIATYARLGREAGARVTIISSDKDLMQLVEDGKVELFDTMKNKRIGTAEVMEKFGVAPSKVVEVQALAGDSVDNVPGVPGIGVKTAAELLGIYGDLETLLARAGEIKQPKRRETLLANIENARISLKLVTLDTNAKLPEGPENFGVHEPDPKELIAFLRGMEFNTITKRVAVHFGIEDIEGIAPAVEPSATAANRVVKQVEKDTPVAPAAAIGAVANREAILKPVDLEAYKTVTTLKELDHWITRAREKAASASIPKPPRSMRWSRACVACRWRWRRAKRVMSPAATARRRPRSRREGRSGPDDRSGGARTPQAAARRSVDREDRPESEIRLPHLPSAGHPRRTLRRYDAHLLCAGWRAARPRHG